MDIRGQSGRLIEGTGGDRRIFGFVRFPERLGTANLTKKARRAIGDERNQVMLSSPSISIFPSSAAE